MYWINYIYIILMNIHEYWPKSCTPTREIITEGKISVISLQEQSSAQICNLSQVIMVWIIRKYRKQSCRSHSWFKSICFASLKTPGDTEDYGSDVQCPYLSFTVQNTRDFQVRPRMAPNCDWSGCEIVQSCPLLAPKRDVSRQGWSGLQVCNACQNPFLGKCCL